MNIFLSPVFKQELYEEIADDPTYRTVEGHRLAETWYIIEQIKDKRWSKALEFGAWDQHSWKLVEPYANQLDVTDNFSWATRACAKQMEPPNQWAQKIKDAGYNCFRLDIQELDLVEEYDLIYSISVLEHVIDDDEALRRIYRALKNGGSFVFTTEVNLYCGMDYNSQIYFRVYSLKEIKAKLTNAGFSLGDEFLIPPDPKFDTEQQKAIFNPNLLIYPHKHFASMGFKALKEEK